MAETLTSEERKHLETEFVGEFVGLQHRYDVNDRIAEIEAAVRELPGAVTGAEVDTLCPVTHSFADGCYIREMRCPAGVLAVTKLHKTNHPFFVLEGECSVLTENRVERIKAPYHGITKAGTKRVVFTHTAVRWVAVHVTDETDLDEIEAGVIATDISELPLSDEEIDLLMETT